MLTASTNPPNLGLKLSHFQFFPPSPLTNKISLITNNRTPNHHHYQLRSSLRSLVTHASSSDGGSGTVDATPQNSSSSSSSVVRSSSRSSEDGYVALFVRMLGLDNDPLDREQAIVALWNYSQGGKHCIDEIMQFRGCINLTVNLLRSDSSSTCEAAAGLLRTISLVNLYIGLVEKSGAIEEITAFLSRSPLTPEVKEQSICTLWNLSVDEKLRVKMANSELLPALTKFLGDEEIKVKEAAGGMLANLALTQSNHNIMVEAGVIPIISAYILFMPRIVVGTIFRWYICVCLIRPFGGIWPESPSFSDSNMPPVPSKWKGRCQVGETFNASSCNRKVIGARYYKNGFEAEEDLTKTFRSPRDSSGHGSHTASTVAGRYVPNTDYNGLGNGGARGGAPMARIAVYTSCWDSGCYDVDVLAAFDDAIKDGVHILSLSLGPQSPQGDYFNDAISIGSFHAARWNDREKLRMRYNKRREQGIIEYFQPNHQKKASNIDG